jgi:hypothetical protein
LPKKKRSGQIGKKGVADLKYESSGIRLLKPRLKLTFRYVAN